MPNAHSKRRLKVRAFPDPVRVAPEFVERAIVGSPTRKITRRNIKYLLGALIWKIGQEIDRRMKGLYEQLLHEFTKRVPAAHRRAFQKKVAIGRRRGKLRPPKCALTMPEIHRLFDAVATDTTGARWDEELRVDERTFAKGIRDHLAFWPDLAKVTRKTPDRW